ncbi:Holliday junction branch migration DNA helicase RuvB [Candidatus Dojkabacteria bacterium]|uniref:Holliday junction branch migration complex subunit RuvB n=1 Tax=Candidatus Dojkabacteria bacterium TaxID=2099670 RepID=A0A955RGS9_9BACT|nr:Holliday junction branch migration DNA helicase RuvB [Candidatus Dojkabacteria bacterium]
MDEYATSPDAKNETEIAFEGALRPSNFKEVIGRKAEKRSLEIMIESAKKRDAAVDHILFHGPPGLGKTTFAYVIAKELGYTLHATSGSVIEKAGDLAAILTSLEPYSVLFIDEIHRLKRTIEEILYPAMEDNVLDIVIGKGPNAKTLRIDLPKFTIIGATTKLSMLSAPLRDRFGMNFRLDFYEEEELTELVKQKAKMMNIGINHEASTEIAKRARMTARIAIRILKRVRDLATVNNKELIDLDTTKEALTLLDIDEYGLNRTDRAIILSLLDNFKGRPVGLGTLAASISEEPETVETVYEPFLLKKGFIQRTHRGRQITDKAEEVYSQLING